MAIKGKVDPYINKSIYKKNSSMFEWYPTSCAPYKFPIRVMSAKLSSSENGQTRIPEDLYCRNGWVEEGSVELMNDEIKEIPDALVYKWLSLREYKAFLYDGKLDKDLIVKYFQDGFISPINDEKKTYQYIIFALAPNGKICVYLSGYGICKAVETLQAKEYTMAGEELNNLVGFYEKLDTYINIILKDDFKPNEINPIDATSYEATKWADAYKKKYNWQLNTILNKKILSLYIENYNGERLYWNDLNYFNGIDRQPITKKIEIKWKESEGDGVSTSVINFDEEEVFKAFNLLNKMGDNIIIQPEINSITYGIDVYIKNRKNVIQLKKCEFETR